jgi:hypothetical protein
MGVCTKLRDRTLMFWSAEKVKSRQLSLAIVVVNGEVPLQQGHFAMVDGATIISTVVLNSISGRTMKPISKTHK